MTKPATTAASGAEEEAKDIESVGEESAEERRAPPRLRKREAAKAAEIAAAEAETRPPTPSLPGDCRFPPTRPNTGTKEASRQEAEQGDANRYLTAASAEALPAPVVRQPRTTPTLTPRVFAEVRGEEAATAEAKAADLEKRPPRPGKAGHRALPLTRLRAKLTSPRHPR